MPSVTSRVLCLVAAPFLFLPLPQDASAQETAKGLLATQARAQGYPCDKPISAKKDAKRSQPDAAYWVLPAVARSVATIRWAHALGSATSSRARSREPFGRRFNQSQTPSIACSGFFIAGYDTPPKRNFRDYQTLIRPKCRRNGFAPYHRHLVDAGWATGGEHYVASNFHGSVRSRSGIGGDRRQWHAGNLLCLPTCPRRLDQIGNQVPPRTASDALARLG